MSSPAPNEKLLKALAVAIVDQPRATLQELARAAGISKATLHRFCGTRENLIEMLLAYSREVMQQVVDDSGLERAAPAAALRDLIDKHLAHREWVLFMVFQYRPDTLNNHGWQPYLSVLDRFFLQGQQAGVFRIDIAAAVITELFTSLLCGLVEAERLGRAAPAGTAWVMEQMFLHGVTAAQPHSALSQGLRG